MTEFQKIRRAVANALDDEKNTLLDRIVDWTVIALILISSIEVFLSTFPAVNEKLGGVLNFIDIFTTVIFTIEVTLRIILAGEIGRAHV